MPPALRGAQASREEGGPPQGRPESLIPPGKKYVVRGADDNDYELRADHFVLDESGVLVFEDHDDEVLIAYSPSFWSYFSVVEED